MAQFMNGPKGFVHPSTQRFVGPYEWYEGPAHQEHEGLHDKKSIAALAKAEKEAAKAEAEAEAEAEETTKEPTDEEILNKQIEAAEEIRKGYSEGGK